MVELLILQYEFPSVNIKMLSRLTSKIYLDIFLLHMPCLIVVICHYCSLLNVDVVIFLSLISYIITLNIFKTNVLEKHICNIDGLIVHESVSVKMNICAS